MVLEQLDIHMPKKKKRECQFISRIYKDKNQMNYRPSIKPKTTRFPEKKIRENICDLGKTKDFFRNDTKSTICKRMN